MCNSRFAHVIAAQFNGHTHVDDIKLFYKKDSLDVVNVAYNGGSVTSYIELNPNFKKYYFDERFNVVDIEQWTYNLEEANKNTEMPPVWYKTYTFRETFNLSTLEYHHLHTLYNRFFYDKEMLQEYRSYQVRFSKTILERGCDKKCLTNTFCGISATQYEDSTYCKAYKQRNNYHN